MQNIYYNTKSVSVANKCFFCNPSYIYINIYIYIYKDRERERERERERDIEIYTQVITFDTIQK